jgi:hypothetical protein
MTNSIFSLRVAHGDRELGRGRLDDGWQMVQVVPAEAGSPMSCHGEETRSPTLGRLGIADTPDRSVPIVTQRQQSWDGAGAPAYHGPALANGSLPDCAPCGDPAGHSLCAGRRTLERPA